MLYTKNNHPESANNSKQYGYVPSNGEKLKINWQIILLIIKTT